MREREECESERWRKRGGEGNREVDEEVGNRERKRREGEWEIGGEGER